MKPGHIGDYRLLRRPGEPRTGTGCFAIPQPLRRQPVKIALNLWGQLADLSVDGDAGIPPHRRTRDGVRPSNGTFSDSQPREHDSSQDQMQWERPLHHEDKNTFYRRAQLTFTAGGRSPLKPAMRLLRIASGAALVLCLVLLAAAFAQTDEIQVYTGEIDKPGEFSITVHNNYTPIGPTRPAFMGGVVPNHSLNGVPEYALGVTPWLELGAYLPLYTITGDERALIDGAKLRALVVSPNAAERTFWYGVNFELSYNARHWQEARYALEIRPILGWRFGSVDLLLNPIIDFPFHGGPGALTFAPADRITYNLSQTWAFAVEHYADYGSFANLAPLSRQYHALFGVIDYTSDPLSLEFGIGHGFSAVSESLILKLIVTRSF